MGDERLSAAEIAWNFKARLKGYKCKNCGTAIPYADREHYFATDLCSYCDYKSDDHTDRR